MINDSFTNLITQNTTLTGDTDIITINVKCYVSYLISLSDALGTAATCKLQHAATTTGTQTRLAIGASVILETPFSMGILKVEFSPGDTLRIRVNIGTILYRASYNYLLI